MAATAKAAAALTLRQETVAAAARLEAGEAAADVVIEKFLETCKADGVPRTSSDAIFWAKIPGHGRLLALRKILESEYVR
jgi:hypothetical protein